MEPFDRFIHWSTHTTGAYGINADAHFGELQSDGACQSKSAMLARDISRISDRSNLIGNRCDIDDRPFVAGKHGANLGLHAQKDAPEIDGYNTIEDILLQIEKETRLLL